MQKGAQKRPYKGSRSEREYRLSGGVPWPELGDGTAYLPEMRVQHADYPDFVGKIQWTEWRGPDGEYLPERTKKATKTKPERPIEGAEWYGVVSWDRPDDPERPLTRLPLKVLVAEP